MQTTRPIATALLLSNAACHALLPYLSESADGAATDGVASIDRRIYVRRRIRAPTPHVMQDVVVNAHVVAASPFEIEAFGCLHAIVVVPHDPVCFAGSVHLDMGLEVMPLADIEANGGQVSSRPGRGVRSAVAPGGNALPPSEVLPMSWHFCYRCSGTGPHCAMLTVSPSCVGIWSCSSS